MSILVAYASKYGATAEVAEAVGKALRDAGVDADVKPAREARSLDGYAAVVLGTPLYVGSMLKDAKKFLVGHAEQLGRLPVAVFMLGPVQAGDDMDEARAQIEPALKKTPWLKPVAIEMYRGAYDPAKLRFPDSLVPKMKATPLYGVPASDNRDWDAIAEWAAGLPAKLGLSAGVES